MRYGKIISQLRKKQGLTQEQLGKKLNISYQAVSKWENDLSEPDLETVYKLSSIFNISISEFFDMAKNVDNAETVDAITKKPDINIAITETRTKDFVRDKPWYIVSILGLIIIILSLCVFLIPVKYSSSQIYEKASKASIYLYAGERSDVYPEHYTTGVFINKTGLAITSYSFIEKCSNGYAKLNAKDARAYSINKVVGVDKELNLAIIQIGISSSNSLDIGNSDKVNFSDKVYAIGYNNQNEEFMESAVSKVGTSSAGKYFQLLATNIATGSVLINEQAKIIGIVTNSFNGDAGMNTVLPINHLNKIKRNINMSIEEYYLKNNSHLVTFMDEDRVYHETLVEHDKTVAPYEPIKAGYKLLGWYKNRGLLEGDRYDFDKKVRIDTKLYAKWEPISYKIEFKSEYGGETKVLTCKYDVPCVLLENYFVREGYVFNGWKYNNVVYEENEAVAKLTIVENDVLQFTPVWIVDE